MKKLFSFALMAVLLAALPLQAKSSWNFTNISETTLQALGQDTQNWANESGARFYNLNAIEAGAALQANGAVIEEAAGLSFYGRFPGDTLAEDQIRIDYGEAPVLGLLLNGNPIHVIIPNLAAGEMLKVTTYTGSFDPITEAPAKAQGITAQNATRTEGEEVSLKLNDNWFTVDEDGNVVICTTGALFIKEIKVIGPAALENLKKEAVDIAFESMAAARRNAIQAAIDSAAKATSASEIEAAIDAIQKAVDESKASRAAYAVLDGIIKDAEAIITENPEAEGAAALQSAIDAQKKNYSEEKKDDPEKEGWNKSLRIAMNAFYAAGASAENPVDVSRYIVNPNFEDGINGWTITNPNPDYIVVKVVSDTLGYNGTLLQATDEKMLGDASGNGRGKFGGYTVEQTLENIPNGDYYLSANLLWNEHNNSNGKDQISGGYNWMDANSKTKEGVKPANATTPAISRLKVRVTDNTLAIKVYSSADRNTLFAMSNFKLEYCNFENWANYNADKTVASVNCMEALYDALSSKEYVDGQDLTIELANGTYDLGVNIGNAFPQTHGNFTIKAASGASPVIKGSLRSSNGLVVNNYTVEGIKFEASEGSTTDSSPLMFHKGIKDTIAGQLTIRNCKFTNMPACIVRINANGAEKLINGLLVEDCTFDGITHHFFQFAGGKNIGLTSFIFRENLVKNMSATGGQFFNTPISPNAPAGTDSIYTMTVEHNVFYKIGGAADKERNFLECNKDNDFKEVYINVNNNIFWDRYSWEGLAESNVALFNAKEGQKVEVNFLNNLLSSEDVFANDILEGEWEGISFPITAGKITANYANFTPDAVDNYQYKEGEKILRSSKLYKAGTNGTYVGLKSMYYDFEVASDGKYVVETLDGLKQAIAYPASSENEERIIQLKNCTDEIGYYNIGSSYAKAPSMKSLTFTASGSPKVYGALVGVGSNIETVLVEKINFVGNGGDANENAAAINSASGSFGTVTFKNCTWTDVSDPLCRLRSNSIIGTLAYEGCTFTNQGALGQQHTFIVNNNNQQLHNFILRDNVFDNYSGKQFMQFANVKAPENSTMNIIVENNTFYEFTSQGNATNFLEGVKTCKNLYFKLNNNLFYYNAMPEEGTTVCAGINPGGSSYENYEVEMLNNVYNIPLTEIEEMTGKTTKLDRNDVYTTDLGFAADWAWKPGESISSFSPLYTAGTEGTYVGASSMYKVYHFVPTATGAIVNTLTGLKEALGYDFGLNDLVIELEDCQDAGEIYLLKTSATAFPKGINSLTITAAKGAQPKVAGSFRSSNGLNLNYYTIENLNLVNCSGSGTEFSTIYFNNSADSVKNTLAVRNCTFNDIPASIMRTKGGYVHTLLFENNVVDLTQHNFIQFDKKFTNVNFIFRENIVKNFAKHGQFFNTHIAPNHPANDDVYTFTVEHNTFYKLGGNGTSARNFIECTDANDWKEVHFNINNNIFWDRYGWENYANSEVALFNAAEGQVADMNICNNLLYPINVCANDALDSPLDMESFHIKDGAGINIVKENFVLEDLGLSAETCWKDAENLILSRQNPLFTAGVEGTYIGAIASYEGASAPEAFYYWASPEGTPIETGGKIQFLNGTDERLNYEQAGYFTICLNGKKGNMKDAEPSSSSGYMMITFDQPLQGGETITVTAFRNKNADGKKASIYFEYENGTIVNGGNDFPNINNEDGTDYDNDGNEPGTVTYTVPAEAAGSKTLKMSRNDAGTNLFITKFEIQAGSNVVEGIMNARTLNGVYTRGNILFIQSEKAGNAQVFDMFGKHVKSVKVNEGLNSIEGLSANKLYIVRMNGAVAKVKM